MLINDCTLWSMHEADQDPLKAGDGRPNLTREREPRSAGHGAKGGGLRRSGYRVREHHLDVPSSQHLPVPMTSDCSQSRERPGDCQTSFPTSSPATSGRSRDESVERR